MSVFKYHAFIYFMRPPPWYGTSIPVHDHARLENKHISYSSIMWFIFNLWKKEQLKSNIFMYIYTELITRTNQADGLCYVRYSCIIMDKPKLNMDWYFFRYTHKHKFTSNWYDFIYVSLVNMRIILYAQEWTTNPFCGTRYTTWIQANIFHLQYCT